MRFGCRVLPPPLEISTNRQNRTPHKPPDHPCRSPQCRLQHTFSALQRLHLTLQCPMPYPGLATHTLAGLCALWLRSAASSSGNLHKPAKPQTPQTTCPSLLLPPVQALPHLAHSEKAAFNLAVLHDKPRDGHSRTGRALCAVVAECCALWLLSAVLPKNATPTNHLPSPTAAPSAGSTIPSALFRGCI